MPKFTHRYEYVCMYNKYVLGLEGSRFELQFLKKNAVVVVFLEDLLEEKTWWVMETFRFWDKSGCERLRASSFGGWEEEVDLGLVSFT